MIKTFGAGVEERIRSANVSCSTWLKFLLVDMCNGNYTNIYNSITVLTVALLEKV